MNEPLSPGLKVALEGRHPVRAALEARLLEFTLEGYSGDQAHKQYHPACYVIPRVLEFPFERYPNNAYPAKLITHRRMRWDHVEQIIRFADSLNQPKGSRAGQPIRFLGFQCMMTLAVFGPEREDGLRMVRDVTMTIARKNSKSVTVALWFLAMMSLGCFNLKAQDIQVGASDREQAGILFDLMQNLILLDRDLGLQQIFRITPSKKLVVNTRTYSRLHCLSSDAYRAHGANPCAVLLDEFGNLPDGKAREFYDVLTTAFGSQLEPLTMLFSTQASDDNHLFSEWVDRGWKNNGSENPDLTLASFLFMLPKVDDGTDGLVFLPQTPDERRRGAPRMVDHFAEANWTRPNPALEGLVEGGFRSLEDLRQSAAKAREMPSREGAFRKLQLNQRLNDISPFISEAAWNACLVNEPPDEYDLGESIHYAALDLSMRRDLTACVEAFHLPDGAIFARAHFYLPQDGIEAKAKEDKVPYDLWAQQGHLNLTPGPIVDYSIGALDLLEMHECHAFERVGFDRAKMDLFKKECMAIGMDPYEEEPGDFWVEVHQGYITMAKVLEAFEAAVVTRRLRILANPCLTWNAANAVTVQDPAGNRKLDKSKSYGRIDGAVALAMVVYLAMEADLEERSGENRSVYEDKDAELLVL